jgi:hypothetical protein
MTCLNSTYVFWYLSTWVMTVIGFAVVTRNWELHYNFSFPWSDCNIRVLTLSSHTWLSTTKGLTECLFIVLQRSHTQRQFHFQRLCTPCFFNLSYVVNKCNVVVTPCLSSKQASWRPQRQHNYSKERTLTIAQHQEKHKSSTWLATSHRQKLA